MLYRGENIVKSNTEILKPVSVFDTCCEITKPDSDLHKIISRIRKVARLDPKAYQALKKQLPFFTGSFFGDKSRSAENFQYASYFIIDIDKCYDNEVSFTDLRSRISSDQRVHLMFTSPGGLGLKLVFELDEPCRSTKFFSDAYRSFAYQFSKEYSIESKTDLSTHDASRVCFLSYDSQAWYYPAPAKISWKSYLPAGDLFTEATAEEEQQGEYITHKVESIVTNSSNDLSPDVYKSILQKLNPDKTYPAPKNYFVPEILNLIEEPVREAVSGHNILVNEIRNIQYGKKFCFSHSLSKAELNVYYGKKGFSVVTSPAGGTNPELNRIVYNIVSEVIFTPRFFADCQPYPQTSI
jgi:hypothetical protein